MHKKANEIVLLANSLVGVRYCHQGRTLNGFDCVGVPIYIAAMLGIPFADVKAYSRRPVIPQFNKWVRDTGSTVIGFKDRAHGDMLRMNYDGWPVHVGILEIDRMGRGWIIHAYAQHRKVSRDPLTQTQLKNISGVLRFPE